MKSKNLIISETKKRKGKSYALNKIIKQTDSDMLLLLDADIRINDPFFIEKIVKPVRLKEADLVTPRIQEIKPENFFEKVLFYSMQVKKKLYFAFDKGNNIYTCFGRARVFSKELYSKIYFPPSLIAEDAFSYLFCVANNFSYKYINDVDIYYKLPGTLRDHEMQSTRFFNTQKQLSGKFGIEFVRAQYSIPLSLLVKTNFEFLLKKPFIAGVYLSILGYMKILSSFRQSKNKWEIATSSKVIK